MSADLAPDQRLRLPDGRVLGYCIYGNPAGMPVLFLHGTPGSRFQIAFAHEVCRGLSVALIAPDRWGYGLSEAPRDPLLSSYADDIAVLMDSPWSWTLFIGGVSGGAPFTAAVAARLATRVIAAAFVSPVGPIADAGLGPVLSLTHRFNFTVVPKYPRVIAVAFRGFHWSVVRAPRLAARLVTLRAASIDKRLIAQPEISERILGSFREGLQRGTQGPQIDLSIFSRPWQIRSCISSRRQRACGSAAWTATFQSRRSKPWPSEFPIASLPSCLRKVIYGWPPTTPMCRSGCTPLHAPAPVRRIDRRNAKGASPCQRLDNT